MTVAPDAAAIVRPHWVTTEDLRVVEREPRLDGPLRAAASAVRATSENTGMMSAVRAMYRQAGLDPTKTRPSSEALLRRVRKGGELPRVNSLVDVVNWCSLETQLPFGLYDTARLHGPVALRLGRPGEEYAGIRKDVVHLAGRLTLADAIGPFGNPSSDSARTMVTMTTTGALVIIFAPAPMAAGPADEALALAVTRIAMYCGR